MSKKRGTIREVREFCIVRKEGIEQFLKLDLPYSCWTPLHVCPSCVIF